MQEYFNALTATNVARAADALDAVLRQAGLPIQAEMHLSAELQNLLLRQPNLPPALLIATVRRFNWHDPAAANGNHLVQRLQARIAAEDWLASLRKTARSPGRWLGLSRPAAAALMLGRGGFLVSRFLPPRPYLGNFLAEFFIHSPFLPGRFDDDRIARIQHLVYKIRQNAGRSRLWPSFLIAAIPAAGTWAVSGDVPLAIFCLTFSRVVLQQSRLLRRQLAIVMISATIAVTTVFQPQEAPQVHQLARWMQSLSSTAKHIDPFAPDAVPEIRAARRTGDSDAMRRAGQALLVQADTTRQTLRAAAWLSAAANRGNVPAMLALTDLYLNMDGLLYNAPNAYFWSGVALRLAHAPEDSAAAAAAHTRAQGYRIWKKAKGSAPGPRWGLEAPDPQ